MMHFKMLNYFCKHLSPFGFAFFLAGFALPTCSFGETPDVEDTTARFQLTYSGQRHPAFQAAYSGSNGIIASGEKMTMGRLTFTPFVSM
jgi:hypothetical protein